VIPVVAGVIEAQCWGGVVEGCWCECGAHDNCRCDNE
jgi:hypothetical protein